MEKRCEEIEQSARKFFGVVRELTPKCCPRPGVISDKHGSTLVESNEISSRWTEYCSELYEQKAQGPPGSDSCELR